MRRAAEGAGPSVDRFNRAAQGTGSAAGSAASGMDKAAASAKNVESTAHAGGSALERMGGFFTHAASTAVGFAAGAVVFNGLERVFSSAGDSLIGFNDTMDRARIGFTQMMGSADAANAMLQDLATFARTTPFQFPELVDNARRLTAMGFAAQDILPTLTAIGDTAAASGQNATLAFDRISLALGQMATRGKVSGEELRQLSEAGVNGIQMLADGFGKSTAEMTSMVEKGLVPADRGLKILIDGMENRAPGAMEKMSTTWGGAVSNIKDSLTQLVAGGFRPLFELLTEGANKLANFLMGPQVQAFARVVSQALGEIAAGIKALFTGDFGRAGEIFADMGRVAAAGLIQILDAAVQAIPRAVQVLGQLAGAAAEWGFNLVASFGQGMLAAAGAVLTAVMNEIVGAISAFIQSFSPPEKGPLKNIEIWGMNLIETYLHAMTKADFGILDDVMGAIKDILTREVNLGNLPKEGLIPALIGSEAVVAQALDQMREFGAISDDVFGQLDQFLGEAAGGVEDLVRGFIELAGVERDLEAINRQLDDLERQVKAETRAWEEAKRPIEDQIRDVERLYDLKIRSADRAIDALERELRAQQALRRDQEQAITDAQKEARLGVEQLRLDEAQGAVARRRAEAEKDVAAATRRVRDAQESLNDARTKKGGADPRQVRDAEQRLQEAQLHLTEAQNDLTKAGVETAKDRLDVLNAQEAVMRSQIDVDTRAAQNAVQNAKDEKDALTRQKEDALDPLNAALDEINETHRNTLRALEDQIVPLEAQRDRLTEQRDAMKEVLDLELTRLDHATQLSDQYKSQLDLLNQMATAAAGAGGAGGGKGGGAGALGGLGAALGGKGIGGGLGLKPIELPKIDEGAIATMAEDLKKKLSTTIDTAIQDLKGDIEASFAKVWDGIDWSRAIPVGVGAAIGAVLGGIFLGGPWGALVGAAIGASIGQGISEIDWKGVIDSDQVRGALLLALTAPLTGPFTPLAALAAKLFGDELKAGFDKLVDVLSPPVTAVVNFVRDEFNKVRQWWEKDGAEITAAAQRIWDAISDLVTGTIDELKAVFIEMEGAWDVVMKVVGAAAEVAWEIIKTTIDVAITIITGFITGLAKLINGDFKGAWDTLVETVANVKKAFTDLIDLALDPAKTKAGELGGVLKDTLVAGINAVRDAAGTAKDKLQPLADLFKWIWDNVIMKDWSVSIRINLPDLPSLREAVGLLGRIPGAGAVGGALGITERKSVASTLAPALDEAAEALGNLTDSTNRLIPPTEQEARDIYERAVRFTGWDEILAKAGLTVTRTDDGLAVMGGKLEMINASGGPLAETFDILAEAGTVAAAALSSLAQESRSPQQNSESGSGNIPFTEVTNAFGIPGLGGTIVHLREGVEKFDIPELGITLFNDFSKAALARALNVPEENIDAYIAGISAGRRATPKPKPKPPEFAGGIDEGPMKSAGYAYLHGDEWVVNSPAQSRQLAATYGGMGGSRGGAARGTSAGGGIDYTRLAQAIVAAQGNQPVIVQSVLDGRVISQTVSRLQGETQAARAATFGRGG